MTAFLILMLVWFVAYLGLFIWLLARKSRIVGGGVALFALSLIPLIFGRWTTPSDWHDHVLMAVYYLPTFLAAFLALIVIVVGLVIKIRQALLTRGGA